MDKVPSLCSIAARLRLKQLRLLIALDDRGSLHKAAEHISISQSGATKALHEVESMIGMPLFERQPKGLVANEMGRCMIRYARLIYSDVAHLREEMLSIMQGQGGRLSVGVIMGAVPLLSRALTELRLKQPQLSVELVENTSATLLGLLDQGRLDLAICRASVGQRSATYDCIELTEEPLAVVASKHHPLAAAQALQLSQLSDYRWVVYPKDMPMRQALERELNEAGLQVPRYPLETSSTFATILLVQQDPTLLAVIPVEVAEFCEQFDLLVKLPVSLRALIEPYGVISRAGADLSPAAALLIHELQQGLTA
ncbi:LysR family transcriptional regulator [Pseudomonas fluorescens]|uniref:HTH-type transcriptional regulator GbpR n=1 Tax=Pseudomonas fluorescens TaxID=294 RepID=A0A5E7RMU8_PSEFL|nr:LysR family transcriptional regulator [Pseudomonas fluorescens]VVN68142.1 HTH-type transcriptional regulator GbpR [Pseudomonas fluorescens]VVP74818.1 HTH-type transcriptional regulator GbpR [Pseudomonas fluorescens]